MVQKKKTSDKEPVAQEKSAAHAPVRRKKTVTAHDEAGARAAETHEAKLHPEQAAVTEAAKGEKKPKTSGKRTVHRKKTATAVPEGATAAPEAGQQQPPSESHVPGQEKPARKPRVAKAKKEHPAPAPAAPGVPAAAAPKPPAPVAPPPPPPQAAPAEVKKEAPAAPRPAAPAAPVKPVQPAQPAQRPPATAPQARPAAPAGAPAPAAPVTRAPSPAAPRGAATATAHKKVIKINEMTTLRDLAARMGQQPGNLILKLLKMGTKSTINQKLDADTATLLGNEFGFDVQMVSMFAEEALVEEAVDLARLKPRPPVVTIMGHVDHGKTSLLDAIRESRVAEGEAGGITQHIGAYKVKTKGGAIAFLDTPGHEAFTAMRARGTKATDIVVLVVSAADGVMPQTVEAIDHAKAASVPIIVAINKIDLPTSNPTQVKQELSKYGLLSEDWGGETITVEVSAKKNINIDSLLEMVQLKAEMMELKANPERTARAVVIEAKLDTRRGPVATVLVQQGTLRVGDNFIVGTTYGKVRAMTDEHGVRLSEATPSTPVEILGITAPPQAGDQFVVVDDERQAREIATTRLATAREDALRPRHHLTLEDISAGKAKEVRIILKADVHGSLEALSDSLERLSTAEINLRVIHRGVGAITESDVTLGAASDALIIGFNLRPEPAAEKMADQEGVSIRTYRIIYEVIADIRAAMEGLLEPEVRENVVGKAQVRQVFKVTKGGTIAGSFVLEGKIQRGARIRLIRDNVIVFDGGIASLKRFKDDVKEVEKGYECGISLENFSDIRNGDIVEAYTQEKVARKLE